MAMIMALTHPDASGRRTVIAGLSQGNIARMIAGQPIHKRLDEYGVPGFNLVILGPDDTTALCVELGYPLPPDMRDEQEDGHDASE